jgi:arylsulfatase A-like enzyme
MQRPNVICVVIDRLHAGFLGAYGNTWISTPAIDRLASQSLVLDRAVIDSPQLESIYRSLWLGVHAICPLEHDFHRESLPFFFSRGGWHTALLTDERLVAEHPLATAFKEKVLIKSSGGELHRSSSSRGRSNKELAKLSHDRQSVQVATRVDETEAAKFFAAAEKWLKSAQSPFLLWLHTGTLAHVWDAPLAFREQFADEHDPSPSNWANVPERILPEEFDPDELLAITHAYAGQVSLLDQLIDSLLETIDSTSDARNTLLILFSPRGFPLGEHRRVGPCGEALYAELTHVPWMIRLPPDTGRPGRSQLLIQPADWSATILDCCGLDSGLTEASTAQDPPGELTAAGNGRSVLPLIRGEQAVGFDRACVVAPGQQVFISPTWSLRLSTDTAVGPEQVFAESRVEKPGQMVELFVKPDDWIEVNEVSNRCPETVEKMRIAMVEFTNACQTGQTAMLSSLPDDLTIGLE